LEGFRIGRRTPHNDTVHLPGPLGEIHTTKSLHAGAALGSALLDLTLGATDRHCPEAMVGRYADQADRRSRC
ncbi:MAG: hypothetical protein EBT02_10965, partial [Planctomycetia bacterium]|nr:hypothetical protein [Planctomycetia bacterium]